ncbi:MAG: 2'-5' RNA ligase family protein, partial [Nitrospirota bacterium]|nr:2'-5' RNA ligase family protein [Nitrospirota bacterium]
MTRFHLWLMPAGGTCERLATIIRHLSHKYGGPLFEPHVTLLGGMEGEEEEICHNTMRLAQGLRPFDVQLTTPGYQDSYFRCLYLHVQETPSLMEAQAQARIILNQQKELQFQPHL